MTTSSTQSIRCFSSASARWIALRLHPGCDVRESLLALAREQSIAAGAIVSAVGSLTQARLRYAGASDATPLAGPWEILNLSGTLGAHGLHVHLAVSDRTGHCVGGHLLPGCVVHTTLELVIADLEGLSFARTFDSQTEYRELEVRPAPPETGPA